MERVKQATRTAIVWSTAINVALGVLCIAFAEQFVCLLNQDSGEVLAIGSAMLRVNALAYTLAGVQIVIGNYFLATGRAKQGGVLSVSRQGCFFLPFLLILTHLWGLTGLIAAQLAARLLLQLGCGIKRSPCNGSG